jgi:hypothetical protein
MTFSEAEVKHLKVLPALFKNRVFADDSDVANAVFNVSQHVGRLRDYKFKIAGNPRYKLSSAFLQRCHIKAGFLKKLGCFLFQTPLRERDSYCIILHN